MHSLGIPGKAGRKVRSTRLFVILLLMLAQLLPFAPIMVSGEASDWGEEIGDVVLEQSWGFGSSANLTLNDTELVNGVFALSLLQNTTNISSSDLQAGNITNLSITEDDDLVLKIVGPYWNKNALWDIDGFFVENSLGSATPVLGDLDDDGDLDAFVGLDNGSVAAYNNTGDGTSPTWTVQDSWNRTLVSAFAVPAFGDLDDDGDLDLLVGDNDGRSYGGENVGNETWPDWGDKDAWDAPDVANGAAPALADLDDDGDLDVLISNSVGQSRAYENIGSASSLEWSRENNWDPASVGGVANPTLGDLDGDGDLDLLIGRSSGTTLGFENTGNKTDPEWTLKSAWDLPDVGDYASPALGDVDGDGDLDVFIGEWGADSFAYENLGEKVDNGTFLSDALGVGFLVNWTDLDWGELLQANTDATFFTRTGNTTDPDDGTWSSWSSGSSTPAGSSISSPPGQYIQVRVFLETTDARYTSRVWDINMTYEYYASNGTIETSDLSPTDLVRWDNLTMVNDSKGEVIELHYSTNGGSIWTSAPSDGDLSLVSTDTGKIRFRVNMSSTHTLTTPEVTGLNLTYMALLDLHHLHLSPTVLEIEVGDSMNFTFEAHDINNNTLTDIPSWTTDIGVVNGTGHFTARTTPGLGYVNVTVGNLEVSAQVTVKVGPLDHLDLEPDTIKLRVGNGTDLSVEGYDRYGNAVADLAFNWSTDVGSVDPSNGTTTTFTARTTPGSGQVKVSVGEMNATAQVTVVVGPLQSIDISPSEVNIDEGDSVQLNGTGTDKYDNEIPGLTFNWTTDVGIVGPAQGSNTTLTAQAIDDLAEDQTLDGNVTATIGDVTAQANVTVIGDIVRILTNLTLDPGTATVLYGETVMFNVTGLDQFGAVLNISANWSTNIGTMDPAVGTSSVLSPVLEEGNGTVTAIVGALSASATVTVLKNETGTDPRILDQIPDQTKQEDSPPWTLDLNPFEGGGGMDDELLWHVEGLDPSLVKVKGEYDTSDVLELTPVPDAHGDHVVSIVLEDAEGNRDHMDIWINITPVDDPPVLEPIPDLLIRYDIPYTFNYLPYIIDIDTSYRDLAVTTSHEAPLETQVSGFNVTFEAPEALKDQEVAVTISVFDGTTKVMDTITISVSENWVPELLNPLPDLTLQEGERKVGVFDLDDHFMDKDEDMMFFTYGNLHASISIDENHSVDVEASTEWSGHEIVTFRATDSKGALIEDDIVITIIAIDDPPVISGSPDLVIRYDSEYTFDLAPYIEDVDTPSESLTITCQDDHVWWAWDPEMAPSHPPRSDTSRLAVMMLFPSELDGQVAPYSLDVVLIVSDGNSQDDDTIRVTVTDNWAPDIMSPLPDVAFDEDTVLERAFRLNTYFFDDDGEQLVFSAESSILNISIKGDLWVDISAPQDWNGVTFVTFRAEDPNGAIVEDTIQVTVRSVNDPPVIDDIPMQEMEAKAIKSFKLGDLVHDVDHDFKDLTIEVETSHISLRVFVSGTDIVIFADEAGNYTVILTVIDPSGATDEMAFSVGVKAAPKPPQPNGNDDQMLSMLLPMLLIIIVVAIVIGASVGYRRYYGKYEIDETFVVMKDGRLIAHLSRHPFSKKDQTVFSGMVAAIQMFIEDAFKGMETGEGGTVHKMEYKGNTIIMDQGEHMYLAVLFKGDPGKRLVKEMKAVTRNIEFRFGQDIVDWDGDLSIFKNMPKELMNFIPHGYSSTLEDPKAEKEN